MGAKETVELIISQYGEKVKPHLERRTYFFALMELGNLRDIAAEETRAILGTVHMGGNFITSLQSLEEACRESPPCTERVNSARLEFEAYSAQTRLPKGSTE